MKFQFDFSWKRPLDVCALIWGIVAVGGFLMSFIFGFLFVITWDNDFARPAAIGALALSLSFILIFVFGLILENIDGDDVPPLSRYKPRKKWRTNLSNFFQRTSRK